jgi:RNA polymerase-binding transcription factor DksA
MTREQLSSYRKALLTLAASLDRGLAHDRREFRREDDPTVPGGPMPSTEDVADDGAAEVEIGLMATGERLLADVVAALDRIDDGTFGTCEECGRPIPQGRLDALPYARQCIRCARAPRPIAG